VVRSKLGGRIQVQELPTWEFLGGLEYRELLLGLCWQISDYMGIVEDEGLLQVSMSRKHVQVPSMADME
jgi:hypothetical protein